MDEKPRYATESNIRILINLIKTALSEYLTDEEITQAINDAIKGISTISFKKVVVLPDTGESNFIYIVPNNSDKEKNLYDEYMWISEDSQFELIGTVDMSEIDLSDYVTKTELSEKGYITSKQLTQKLEPFLLKTDIQPIDDDEITKIWNEVWSDLHGGA